MKKNILLLFVLLILITSFTCKTMRDMNYEEVPPPISKDDRMGWWREAKFGMFIHWGVYAVPAGVWQGKEIDGIGEWIMSSADISREEYEKLPPQFNPVEFDANEWVDIAVDAGMKYLVITSKHHDGFSMYKSKVSPYNIVDATPYDRDVLKELSDACDQKGIKFCIYYSILDWHHPSQYKNSEGKNGWEVYGHNLIYPEKKQEYVTYMKSQLKEIIESYHPGIIWFDGGWTDWWTPEDGEKLMDYLWKLDPHLIINNRAAGTEEMEQVMGDYLTPEQFIPEKGEEKDWETCMTMNDSWGYKKNDHNWKATKDLIVNLVDVASKGGNLLLNVGPTDRGKIPQASVDRLDAIGNWLRINGEAIYGTSNWEVWKQGPHEVITDYYDDEKERKIEFTAEDIRFTVKGNSLYAICLGWPEKEIRIEAIGKDDFDDRTILKVQLLGSEEQIIWNQSDEYLNIHPPRKQPGDYAYSFKIVYK